jgi:hypothetical protein
MGLARITKNNTRHFPDGIGPRPDNTKHKREEAKERQAYWDGLSAKDKLARLDAKLGVGVGAKKQRALLQDIIDGKVKPKTEVKEEVSQEKKPKLKAKERRVQENKSELNQEVNNPCLKTGACEYGA